MTSTFERLNMNSVVNGLLHIFKHFCNLTIVKILRFWKLNRFQNLFYYQFLSLDFVIWNSMLYFHGLTKTAFPKKQWKIHSTDNKIQWKKPLSFISKFWNSIKCFHVRTKMINQKFTKKICFYRDVCLHAVHYSGIVCNRF